MKLSQLLNLKIGDTIFATINSSTVSKYQYIGIFTDHATQETKRVFLSPYFVSTITLLYGREKEHTYTMQSIFLTEKEAIEKAKELQCESIDS